MKVLLTGGSGFLGSALAARLQDVGHDVALLLRPSSSLARLAGRQFEMQRVATDDDVLRFVEHVQPQAVIHAACAYGRRGETLLQLADANLRLGLVLLQALERVAGPVVFLHVGTSLPASTSAYALAKHQFAEWARRQALTDPQRLRFVHVALEHMYGPGDDPSKFTAHVLHACHRHEPVLRLTPGLQRRDFIYVDDVVEGFQTLLAHAGALEPCADVPLGSGEAPTVREFVQTVHRLCGSRTELAFGALPYRAGEPMHCQADLTRMRNLGWHPRWGLEAGLRRTIDLEFGSA